MFFDVVLVVVCEVVCSKIVLVVGDVLFDVVMLDKGNCYIFCVCFLIYMLVVMLVEQVVCMLGWCWVMVVFNYEYGQSVVVSFKMLLKQVCLDVEFVSDQWLVMGKIKVDDVVWVICQLCLDVIFNVIFGEDLQKFVQVGNCQQLFVGVWVVLMSLVGVQSFDFSQSEVICDWVVVGYLWDQINIFEYQCFLEVYLKKFSECL